MNPAKWFDLTKPPFPELRLGEGSVPGVSAITQPVIRWSLSLPSARTPIWVLTWIRNTSVCAQFTAPQLPSRAGILLNKKLSVENTPASAIKLFGRNIKHAGKNFLLGHRLSVFLGEVLLLSSGGKSLCFSSWQQFSAFLFQISVKNLKCQNVCHSLNKILHQGMGETLLLNHLMSCLTAMLTTWTNGLMKTEGKAGMFCLVWELRFVSSSVEFSSLAFAPHWLKMWLSVLLPGSLEC